MRAFFSDDIEKQETIWDVFCMDYNYVLGMNSLSSIIEHYMYHNKPVTEHRIEKLRVEKTSSK